MRKLTFRTEKDRISQPKRYTFCKSFLSKYLQKIHNSLITSILQKPQNLAPFCEEKFFCAKHRPSRASFVVNVSNCKFIDRKRGQY